MTGCSTLGSAMGSSNISSHGLDTTTYAQAGNRWSNFRTHEIWSTCFTDSVPISNVSRGIKFGGGAMEDMEAVWMLHWYFGFIILFSSLLIGSWPGINGVCMGFTTSQCRRSFPVCWICWTVTIELNWLVVGHMGSYDCLHRVIGLFFVSLSFFSHILALAAKEICTYRGG